MGGSRVWRGRGLKVVIDREWRSRGVGRESLRGVEGETGVRLCWVGWPRRRPRGGAAVWCWDVFERFSGGDEVGGG